MMRERYESLSAFVLKDLAKARGIKGVSAMKKSQIIERMLEEDAKMAEADAAKPKTKAETEEKNKPETKPKAEKKAEHNAEAKNENDEKQTQYDSKENDAAVPAVKDEVSSLDSGITANGILEVMSDGFGFIRCENYMPGENDVYVAPSQIRRFNLKTGDIITGNTRIKTDKEKFSALLYVGSVNGYPPAAAQHRKNFEDLTPIFPNQG